MEPRAHETPVGSHLQELMLFGRGSCAARKKKATVDQNPLINSFGPGSLAFRPYGRGEPIRWGRSE